MKISKVIKVQSDTGWLLKVNNNIYGERQAGIIWNKSLMEKLTSSAVKFRQSSTNECMFYRGGSCI